MLLVLPLQANKEGQAGILQNQSSRIQMDTTTWEFFPRLLMQNSVVKDYMKGREVGQFSYILSLAGNNIQKAHWDWDPAWSVDEDDLSPVGIWTALEEGARLRLYHDIRDELGVVLHLRPGDALVFRGDVLHAGESYENDNLRMHLYLETPTTKRKWKDIAKKTPKSRKKKDHNVTFYPPNGPHAAR